MPVGIAPVPFGLAFETQFAPPVTYAVTLIAPVSAQKSSAFGVFVGLQNKLRSGNTASDFAVRMSCFAWYTVSRIANGAACRSPV